MRCSRIGPRFLFGIVRNATTRRRDMELVYALDPSLRRVETVSLEVLGRPGLGAANAEGRIVL